jgi:hypothetical protein
MTRRLRDNSKPKLSFEQANAICRNWIALGDEVDRCFEQMTRLGFEAFVPRNEYVESFAANEAELATHRRCLKETVRELLGQPRHFPIGDDELKQIYYSPFLESLRRRRDQENGCSETELSLRFEAGEATWRREIDPCQRNIARDMVARRMEHEARFETVVEIERNLAAEEARRFSTGLGARVRMFDEKDRYALFVEVMLRDAASLGFEFDNKRSHTRGPLFFKTITDDWRLCWSIDSRFLFFTPTEGRFLPSLHLCSRKIANPRDVTEPYQTLLIRYDAIIYGLLTAYWAFFDFDQLERAIRSHLQLYGLAADIIEGGIKKILVNGLIA